MERRLKVALGVGLAAFAALRLFGGSGGAFDGPTGTLRRRILDIALAEERAGVYEVAGTSNRSPRIDEYAATAGLGQGGPWCAAFVTWVLTQALGFRPRWTSPSTSWLMVEARDAYRSGKLAAEYVAFASQPATLQRVKPGWVWVKGNAPAGTNLLEVPKGGWTSGHTGIVVNPVGNAPGTYLSVDGNTTGGGGTPGGVYVTVRKWADPSLVIAFDPVALTAALQPRNA